MEKTDKENTAMRDHIKRRITRKPNRVIKRSFIESAMCNHNIVILLMGMLVFLDEKLSSSRHIIRGT